MLQKINYGLRYNKADFSDGQLLHRIWNSGPECRRWLQLY